MSARARERARHDPRWTLAASILASSLSFVDGSVLNVALPAIRASYGAGAAEVQWVVNAYLLPLSALLLLGGALGDHYGRRLLLIIGTSLFGAASLVCALAPSLEILLAARGAQGVGAALLLPNSLALLNAAYQGEKRGRAVGIWAAAGAAAAAVAPLIGGWLVDHVGWPSIFYINLPLAAGAVLLAIRFVTESRDDGAARTDYAGAFLATAGLGGTTYGLTLWSSSGSLTMTAIASIVVGLVLLVMFLGVERRRGDKAMMPLGMFADPCFSGLNLLTLLLYGAFGVAMLLIPYVLIEAAGYSPVQAGLALLPLPILLTLASPPMGQLAMRIGPRWPLIVGPLIVGGGMLLGQRIGSDTNYWTAAFPAITVMSIGMAIAVAPLTSSVLGSVKEKHVGLASGFNSAVARTGGLIATALLGVVLARSGEGLIAGFHLALVGSAIAAAGASLSAMFLVRDVKMRGRRDPHGALTIHRKSDTGSHRLTPGEMAMHYTAKPLALALAAGALMGVTPAETYSPAQLALLDPTIRLASLCGGTRGRQSMRARLAFAAAVVGAQAGNTVPSIEGGLGNINFPITTTNPDAQRHFARGLGLAYGFNHAGAIASFREAQRLDPACAMCWWGEAMARGPNINAPMDANANARTVAAARYAQWLAAKATPAERALADAMVKRYSPDPAADRAPLDAAYADAMLAAAAAHPANDDVALLAAEAAMDTLPWNYWEPDGRTPKPRLGNAIQLVETVMKRNPDHPQAAHLYIHLMEAGPDPKRAEAAADRLATPLAPAAGHLVHMPAHIYLRLGRWKDSMRVNVEAARADEAYIRASGDRGLVRYGYYPHNVHFIVTSAQMAGDLGTAIREARRLDGLLDPAVSSRIAWIQAINAAPYFAAAQFAAPAAILSMRAPDSRLPYVAGVRYYSRAVARAHLRDRNGFAQEIAQLRRLRETSDFKSMIDQGVPAPDLLLLAETVARGRMAFMTGRYGEAIRLYNQAIAVEDKLPYMEPPFWYYPVRQSLGAALYRAGRYDEAREAFTTALAKSPNNGWALYGLASAERALGRRDLAAGADAALNRAWLGNPKWLRMDRL